MNKSMIQWLASLFFCFTLVGCQTISSSSTSEQSGDAVLETATFAGGCFWAMQPHFDAVDGVEEVRVGFMGGQLEYPLYDEVIRGMTDHLEVIKVRFDPRVVSFEELLDVFWRTIDPTDEGGQFADRGPNYRTAIFYHDDHQRLAALRSLEELATSGRFDGPVVTQIRVAEIFWSAGLYHQDYYRKKPDHFNRYLRASGRPAFIQETWGASSEHVDIRP